MENLFVHAHQPRISDAARAATAPDSAFMENYRQALLASPKYCTRADCCSFFTFEEDEVSGSSSADALPAANDVLRRDLEAGAADLRIPRDTEPRLSGLEYPLLLFADLPPLPDNETLSCLLEEFHHVFVSSSPFLQSMSLPRSGAPPYLILPMALLGAAISTNPEHSQWVKKLWRATEALLVGVLEVDNSLARSSDYLHAATLLMAYGVLQAHGQVWRKTQAYSGYLAAPLHKMRLKDIGSNTGSAAQRLVDLHGRGNIGTLGFYFLVDVLRAIHFNTPPSLTAAELSLPISRGHDFRPLYKTLVVDHKPLPVALSSDGYLLLLIALLSDIVSASHGFGSLTVHPSLSHQQTCPDQQSFPTRPPGADEPLFWSDEPTGGSRNPRESLRQESLNSAYCNPLLPFSATQEYFRIKKNLEKALDAWSVSVGLSGGGDVADKPTVVDSTIIPILHFCRMLLEAGPSIYLLPAVVGYTPIGVSSDSQDPGASFQRNLRSLDVQRAGFSFNNAVLSSAWQILESIEADHHHTGVDSGQSTSVGGSGGVDGGFDPMSRSDSSSITPIWYPLIVFYAALVVWARLLEDSSRKSSGGDVIFIARKKVLGTFQIELEQMKPTWGCTERMVAIIKSLK
ncbi:uncharacterized protein A1O9_02186 [Exophiala aquamarina CBS 119918]|uniref:Transcription factor domain-containing protein n=1 Tax=Exophiala aquamarina CBS 119918 TaxID=1182545 RepID=A0A072PYC7_9EURO|nr:uncharacterized protein A1O9_02186 [Exophiala aquamarina CBS 119918]KEF60625.1 hypothetical protein A1O9_02186 [Exophiala aquamarina CBS 119918]